MSSRGPGRPRGERKHEFESRYGVKYHFQGCSLISCVIHIVIHSWKTLCRRGRPDYKNPDSTGC